LFDTLASRTNRILSVGFTTIFGRPFRAYMPLVSMQMSLILSFRHLQCRSYWQVSGANILLKSNFNGCVTITTWTCADGGATTCLVWIYLDVVHVTIFIWMFT